MKKLLALIVIGLSTLGTAEAAGLFDSILKEVHDGLKQEVKNSMKQPEADTPQQNTTTPQSRNELFKKTIVGTWRNEAGSGSSRKGHGSIWQFFENGTYNFTMNGTTNRGYKWYITNKGQLKLVSTGSPIFTAIEFRGNNVMAWVTPGEEDAIFNRVVKASTGEVSQSKSLILGKWRAEDGLVLEFKSDGTYLYKKVKSPPKKFDWDIDENESLNLNTTNGKIISTPIKFKNDNTMLWIVDGEIDSTWKRIK